MLNDHIVGRKVLFPGVGYVEAACATAFRSNSGVCFSDIAFVRPCALSARDILKYMEKLTL